MIAVGCAHSVFLHEAFVVSVVIEIDVGVGVGFVIGLRDSAWDTEAGVSDITCDFAICCIQDGLGLVADGVVIEGVRF